MPKRAHRENEVGPWARQKLDALESYLIAYQQVMSKQTFRTVFVDAFAGAGRYRVRGSNDVLEAPLLLDQDEVDEQEGYINGSPVRALGLERKFDHYRFIDADPIRAQLLAELEAEYPTVEMKALVGDANVEVQRIADNFGAKGLRGVAFLDPYGAHLHWETIEKLAATEKFDVIINCPIHMAIDRFVKRSGDIPENWVAILDQCFGCHDWFDVSFEHRDDLFGPGGLTKREDAAKRQLDLYVQRLRGVFNNVSKPSLVTGIKGQPLYYLIWAGHHGRGAPIAEHILDLGAKVQVPRRIPPK